MIAELKLHNGKMNLYQYLEQKRMELDLSRKETSELDRARGTTPRMRGYCRLHGLDDVSDLKRIWKKPKTHYIWRVGKNEDNITT